MGSRLFVTGLPGALSPFRPEEIASVLELAKDSQMV